MSHSHHAELDQIFEIISDLRDGEIHFKSCPKTNLHALICIDSTQRGPALGGCRFIPYASVYNALQDAKRLAQGMTYKSALANIPYGGGKAVILKPQHLPDRQALFRRFGDFVNDLGGRYITAMDSGTDIDDMHDISHHTKYCASAMQHHSPPTCNPSPYTAHGVFLCIQAAVEYQLKRDDLKGLKVAIQGLGHVGFELAKLCHQAGCKIIAADVNLNACDMAKKQLDAEILSVHDIINTPCDVLAPCALGGVLRKDKLDELNTTIIAGSANNQLAEESVGDLLQQRGILYAPDFVINSGGLIAASEYYEKGFIETANETIAEIPNTLANILRLADEQSSSTEAVALALAIRRLQTKII